MYLHCPIRVSPDFTMRRITKEFWQTLAKDKDLTQDTFDHLLDILNRSPPFTEKEDARDKKASIRTATLLPVAVCIRVYFYFVIFYLKNHYQSNTEPGK